jgi:hypothetical protein
MSETKDDIESIRRRMRSLAKKCKELKLSYLIVVETTPDVTRMAKWGLKDDANFRLKAAVTLIADTKSKYD